MLRPTMSPGLYVQMAGRGMRIAEDKQDCLVLDFAGNVSTHGPITAVQPPSKKIKGDGVAPTKECEACHEIVTPNTKICPSCGFEFPESDKKEAFVQLHDDDIMGFQPIEMPVTAWKWAKHVSRTSGKEMLRVSYYGGISDPIVTEYLTVLHEGYAGEKALRLLRSFFAKQGISMVGDAVINDLVSNHRASHIAEICEKKLWKPDSISYLREGKFFKVMDRTWA